MLKNFLVIFVSFLCISQAQALEKSLVDLDKTFWGKWTLINVKNSCSEKFEFKKPNSFIYQANKKNMDGDFIVFRNSDEKILDLLILDIKNDNGGTGCGSDNNNYQGKKSNFFLKWLSPTSAELCMDNTGKQCTGLYLNKR